MIRGVRGRVVATAGVVLSGLFLAYVAIAPTQSGTSAADAQTAINTTGSTQLAINRPGQETVPADLREFYAQRVSWGSCASDAPADFVCGSVMVPVSYAKPKSFGTLQIQMTKRPATTSKNRLGSLLVNPGGPGGSGIEYAQAADLIVSGTVLDRYDLIGFDPRGVASSDPIKCLSDAKLDGMLAVDATPDTPAEVSQFRAYAKALGDGCQRDNPELFPRVDTESAARDMDIIRAVLGDARMNYLGKSYGTFLGSTYARLFPSHVGRFVLDGVIDPRMDNRALSKAQAMGFERALHRFLQDCARRSDCPLKRDGKAAYSQLLSIVAKTDATPITTNDPNRPLTQALLQTGIIVGMYDATYGWQAERQALRGVVRRDGADMLNLIDFFVSREDGHYKDNSNEVIAAVNCIDRPDRPDAAATAKYAADWNKEYPMFGAVLAYGLLTCERWPAPAVGKANAWKGSTNPVLIIGNTYDPATPVEGAKALHAQMRNSRFIEWVGDGHTAYRQGSSCVDSAVDSFFLASTLPTKDLVCRS
jgi:pimeloyl-ACP methyl ester carboxylesterase